MDQLSAQVDAREERWVWIGRRPLARRVAWLTLIPVLLGICSIAGLRLNLTSSMPVGLYLTTRGPLTRGSTVLACLPAGVALEARLRGYVSRGGLCPHGTMPVGKPILALPGDTVTVTPTALVLNGRIVANSARLAADRNGRSLPQLPYGEYHVKDGELWLVSNYSRLSFDSRYFGPVNETQVQARVRALWVLGPRKILSQGLRTQNEARLLPGP